MSVSHPIFHPLLEQRFNDLGVRSLPGKLEPHLETEAYAPFGPAEEWDVDVQGRAIDGPHGAIPLRVYRPSNADGRGRRRPALVWLHGGCFWGGDLDMPESHEVARGLAGRADAVVVCVDYRLCEPVAGFDGGRSPAHNRFPIPVDEVVATYQWLIRHASDLGVDANRMVLAGASAGGCLAAAAALRMARAGQAPWQVFLMYPTLHPHLVPPPAESASAVAAIPPALKFPPELFEAMNENYYGQPLASATDEAFPGLADDLYGYPPTLIDVCEFDDLRGSGERFAKQLRSSDVPVELAVSRGVPHGHLNLIGLPVAHDSLDRMASRLQQPRLAATP